MPGIEVGDDAMGSYEPDGGYIEPRQAIETFAALARAQGATTRTGVDKPRVIVEGGRAVGVSTSEGEFRAPNVVLATGPWTKEILRELGVEAPLRVVRSEEHFVEMPDPPAPEESSQQDDGHADDIETRFRPDPLELRPVAHPGDHRPLERPARSLRAGQRRTRLGRIGFEGLLELERPGLWRSRSGTSCASGRVRASTGACPSTRT